LASEGIYQGERMESELIETHISWVLLLSSRVLKIKKPMKYSFLDFSTLAKRKHYCERELLLNSRLTSIYLQVAPVKLNHRQYYVGEGPGSIVDYALVMKKMPANRRMDLLLDNGLVTLDHIDALAKTTAHFHQKADIIKTPFKVDDARDLFNDILSVCDWINLHVCKAHGSIVTKAVDWSNSFLEGQKNLIFKRIEEGFQRDVHGDLHSRNIFLLDHPVIFDCIEFNDSFRQIDVLNEVAFFCMDLEAHKKWELSSHFMTTYLQHFPCMRNEEEGALLNYYKAYRANVRAKVNVLRAMQTTGQTGLVEEVKMYLELLAQYIEP